MRLIIFRLTLLYFSIINTSLLAQKASELIGKWTVSCPVEKMSESSGNACDLCPANFNTSTKGLSISAMEMEFDKKSILIKTENDLKTTFYNWDEAMRILEFKYNEKLYIFKVLYQKTSKVLILKEADGMLVLLEPKT